MRGRTLTAWIGVLASGGIVAGLGASQQAPPSPPKSQQPSPAPARLRVLFTGSDDGYLDACGCDDGLLGGLPRRGTLLPTLGSENGDTLLLSNGRLVAGSSPLDGMKFEAIRFAMAAMGYDAIALTERELALGRARLVETAEYLGAECPLLGTNLVDTAPRGGEGEAVPPLPGVRARAIDFGKREVLLLSAVATSRAPLYAAADRFVTVEEPKAALERELAAHASAWRVVVLGQMSFEEASALARAVPRIDLLIVQGPEYEDYPLAPAAPVGRTTIVTTGRKGKFVGRFEQTGDEPGRVDHEPVADDGTLQKSPLIQDIVTRNYRDRLLEDEPRPIEAFLEQRATASGASYVGSAEGACAGCHPKAWATWAASRHARAWRTLVDQDLPPAPTDKKGRLKNAIWDPDCVRCHVTGFGERSGYAGIEKEKARGDAPLVNVTCEACHGPAGDHAERAADGDPTWPGQHLPKVWLPEDAAKDPARALSDNAAAEKLCMRCHDPDNSPSFDLRTFWQGVVKGEQREPVAHGRE